MTNEVRSGDLLNREQLTTSDLAQAGEQRVRTVEVESGNPDVRLQPESHDHLPPQSGTATAAAAARAKTEEELGPLFSGEEANDLRARWDNVQAGFVDEPRQAVEDADRLIAATMKRLAEIFADERQKLEHQWDRGDNVSTEDLCVALRRYRSFFSRLLNV